MSHPVTEKKRPPIKWIVPIPTNEGGSFGRPSLCAACRGNDIMAVILNYFVYEASTEVEREKIDTLKVQSIQLIRTHDQILEGCKPSRVSKKTLIDYMHKLEAWGFLKVDGYHHIYEVFFPAITEAMKTPPPAEKRKPRGRHVSQKVKSTNLQSSEVKSTNHAVKTTNSEDCTLEQISNLQSEMLNLQSEMSKLQFQMLNLTFRQSSEAASQQMLTPLSEAPRLIDCNRLIETSNYVAANAGNDTPSFSFPILDASSEAVTDETFKVAVMDDWREYKHLPRITPTIDVMSEVLKRLQRASVTPDFSTQANAVENPGQLADPSTVSQARDNGGTGATDSLVVENGVDPVSHSAAPTQLSPTSQSEVTSQHEVVQASNGQSPIAAVATRNLDEEHAALLRLGENATTGDGDTPTESGAQEETPTRRTRKPVEKKDEPTKAQIDAVYVVFDELFRETLETPDPDFSCTRTKTSTENIKELIRRKATPARLRAVFKNMWDEQNEDGDYWWRKRGRMTIKAVCNGYSSRVISLESPKVRATKGVSIQQQLQDKVPDFPVLSQVELMRMQPAQRKEYSQQFDAYLKAQREREERAQSERQQAVQQVSA